MVRYLFRILANMKQPQTGNKSFILLGLTFLLGAFLTIIFSNQTNQRQDDFSACELTEYLFDSENQDADDPFDGFETTAVTPYFLFQPYFFFNKIGNISGNSFVPLFFISRKILYLQLQLHHG